MSRYRQILLLVLVVGVLGDIQTEFEKTIEGLNNGNVAEISNIITEINANTTGEKYDFKNDETIKVWNLNRAIENLYLKQGKYRGSQNTPLFDLQEELTLLMDDNRRTNNAVFRWTVMGRGRFNFIVLNHDKLQNIDGIKKFTEDVMDMGKTTVDRAVNENNQRVQSLLDQDVKSRSIQNKLQEELNTSNKDFDEYERNRTEFNQNLKLRREDVKRKLAECEENNRLAGQGLSQFVSCADLVSQNTLLSNTEEMPSKEEQRVALNNTYKALMQALEMVITGEKAYAAALSKEIDVITDLKAKTIDAVEKSVDVKTIVSSLQQLASDFHKYVEEHSGRGSSATTNIE